MSPVNKPKRRGSYAPLSTSYYEDEAIAAAGFKAELLYVRSLAFCAKQLRNGYINRNQLSYFSVGLPGPERLAAKLVEVGLWVAAGDGWVLRSWLDWNRSREEIMELNERDNERKKAQVSEPPPPPPPDGTGDQLPLESEWMANGVHADSERNPHGRQTDSVPRARGSISSSISSSSSTSSSSACAPLSDHGSTRARGGAHAHTREGDDPTRSQGHDTEPDVTRAATLTEGYLAQEPMALYERVHPVVLLAVRSGKYRHDEIADALARLAADDRSVTVETLRIELSGGPRARPKATSSSAAYLALIKDDDPEPDDPEPWSHP